MRWMMRLAVLLAVLGLTATIAFSAEWHLYYESKDGFRAYIDKGSMRLSPDGNFLVWEKLDSTKSGVKSKTEQLLEVDCTLRRYKILQGSSFRPNGTHNILPSKGWIYFPPSDTSPARFDAICGKGRKK